MSKRTSYYEKLKDPRWQQKRLEILERDEWKCQWCGSVTSELHVHHLVYRKGEEPWESPNQDLLTLCHSCHKTEAPQRQDAILDVVTAILRAPSASPKQILLLAEYIDGLSEYGLFNIDQICSLLDVNTFEDTWRYVNERDEKEWQEIKAFLAAHDKTK